MIRSTLFIASAAIALLSTGIAIAQSGSEPPITVPQLIPVEGVVDDVEGLPFALPHGGETVPIIRVDLLGFRCGNAQEAEGEHAKQEGEKGGFGFGFGFGVFHGSGGKVL